MNNDLKLIVFTALYATWVTAIFALIIRLFGLQSAFLIAVFTFVAVQVYNEGL